MHRVSTSIEPFVGQIVSKSSLKAILYCSISFLLPLNLRVGHLHGNIFCNLNCNYMAPAI